jgi:hypothetical protein
MKAIALLLAVACCLAYAAEVPTHTADKAYLIKQKNIYELFWHVDQPTVYHPELYQKARSFNLEDNIASFTDQVLVTYTWKKKLFFPYYLTYDNLHQFKFFQINYLAIQLYFFIPKMVLRLKRLYLLLDFTN